MSSKVSEWEFTLRRCEAANKIAAQEQKKDERRWKAAERKRKAAEVKRKAAERRADEQERKAYEKERKSVERKQHNKLTEMIRQCRKLIIKTKQALKQAKMPKGKFWKAMIQKKT